jgi:hypothetical protein
MRVPRPATHTRNAPPHPTELHPATPRDAAARSCRAGRVAIGGGSAGQGGAWRISGMVRMPLGGADHPARFGLTAATAVLTRQYVLPNTLASTLIQST